MPRSRIIAVACACALFAGSAAWAAPSNAGDGSVMTNGPHRPDFVKDSWSSALSTADDITSEVTWLTGSTLEEVLTFHGSSSNYFLRQDRETTSLKEVALYSVMDSGVFDVDLPGLNFRLYGGVSNEAFDNPLYTLEDPRGPNARIYHVIQQDQDQPVPEPTSIALLGSGLAVLAALRTQKTSLRAKRGNPASPPVSDRDE